MISYSHTKLSGLFNVIRNFLFVIFFTTGVFFPNLCLAKELTAQEEYNAQKKLMQLQGSVDNEDYIRAQLVLSSFKRDFSDTKFYKEYSKTINNLDKKIKKESKKIKVEDKIEYLFVPPRLETKLWKEYMSKAESIVSQSRGKTGIAVLSVIFEDESLERPSVRTDWRSNNELNIYGIGGGYSPVGNFQNEGPVFVGSGFWRYHTSDSNDKNVSAIGDIITGGIYHYPTKLKIEVQSGKAIAYGEVFVRTIPKEYCGNLLINVKAEEGVNLTNAGVSLKVSGFYAGKTGVIREDSCIFNSIGPGTYSVEMASNDTIGGPGGSAEVFLGQTTEVTINAYRHRTIEFDWRFRRTGDPNNWLSGKKIMKTDESWQPDGEWPGVRYPVVAFGDWLGDTCKIRSSNGDLMHIDANEPFENMDFPLNFSSFSRDYPIKEGNVFAWKREDHEAKDNFLEALIYIRKITPVGIPDDPKSSIQEKKN